MYLKSIEVQGFKSFANKTVFQFHNGITGIVGPNGSGKSNVADAVRWVLGEQRVKQLRGGTMQDVIFAGTQSRKPLGYAYVAITLDNHDHSLPISFDEVTVSRRLYRSGESEYMINGSQCRLKDVSELFYDTGIGKEGYSIIGQGQIERILSGKPEERRELFDEAAGIVKFKRRKLEAERKLEDEQQKLVRVNDILTELSRQLGPLEKQAEKARVYLKKRDELKAYDVNLFLQEYQQLKEKISQAVAKRQQIEEELGEVREETGKIRGQYEEAQTSLAEMEETLENLRNEESRCKVSREQILGRIEILRDQIRSQKQADTQRLARSGAIDKELGEKEKQEKRAAEEEKAFQEQRRLKDEENTRLEESHRKLLGSIDEASGNLDKTRQEQIRLLNDHSQINAQAQRFDVMLDQIRIRRSELSSQVLRLRSEEAAQGAELERLGRQQKAVDQEIEAMNVRNQQANDQLTVSQDHLTGLNQQIEQEQENYHREASRLETLRNIAERYDGYGNSIRRVMEKREQEKGILGVVADLIRTEKTYEMAIETALGGSIQNIVTEDEETAKRMIEYLKQNRYGRATFLPLTAVRGASRFQQTEVLNEPGVIGMADTLVEADRKYAGLVRNLLGKCVVVDSIDHAIEVARKFRYSLRLVTLEGELLAPGGSMTGGAFRNSSNLLGRRREIEELTLKVSKKQKELEDLRAAIDTCRLQRNNLRDEIRTLGDALHEKFLEKNTLTVQYKEIENLKQTAGAEYNRIREENQALEQQEKDLVKEHEEAERSLEEASVRQEALAGELETRQKELDSLREEEKELALSVEQLHVEQMRLSREMEYRGQEVLRCRQECEALRREKQELADAGAVSETEAAAKQEEIERAGKEAESLLETGQESSRKIQELTQEKGKLLSAQKKFFDRQQELTEKGSLLEREGDRLAGQEERYTDAREQRISYMWEQYELTYQQALPLRRDDLGKESEWKRRMSSLRKEIRDLGSVNVNAIDEYKELSERHAFLDTQHGDLIRAEAALRKIIAELDEGMRRQFREQFALIQKEFDKSFSQLFGGGKGTLELVEDEDILEAGIRIIAQPPGKKLQNMMQLSGGEKALTAIALLFAIQNLKPSPFCLLDEIEAALDENNVERYAGYLHKLTKHTQFIIITHRRGTMAAADRLYGVTMQEKGVSALVSVNLIEDELDN